MPSSVSHTNSIFRDERTIYKTKAWQFFQLIKSPTIDIYPLMNTPNGCEGNLNEERGGEILASMSGNLRARQQRERGLLLRPLPGPLWCL